MKANTVPGTDFEMPQRTVSARGLGGHTDLGLSPLMPVVRCVVLGTLPEISELQPPHLQMRLSSWDYCEEYNTHPNHLV